MTIFLTQRIAEINIYSRVWFCLFFAYFKNLSHARIIIFSLIQLYVFCFVPWSAQNTLFSPGTHRRYFLNSPLHNCTVQQLDPMFMLSVHNLGFFCSSRFQPVPAGSSRFQPVPAGSSRFQQWLQLILLNPLPDGPLAPPLTDGPRSDWT